MEMHVIQKFSKVLHSDLHSAKKSKGYSANKVIQRKYHSKRGRMAVETPLSNLPWENKDNKISLFLYFTNF